MTGIIVNVGKRAHNFKKATFSGFSVDAVFILLEFYYCSPFISYSPIAAKTGLKGHIHPSKTLLKD